MSGLVWFGVNVSHGLSWFGFCEWINGQGWVLWTVHGSPGLVWVQSGSQFTSRAILVLGVGRSFVSAYAITTLYRWLRVCLWCLNNLESMGLSLPFLPGLCDYLFDESSVFTSLFSAARLHVRGEMKFCVLLYFVDRLSWGLLLHDKKSIRSAKLCCKHRPCRASFNCIFPWNTAESVMAVAPKSNDAFLIVFCISAA